ncbi:DUF6498-containing protein [Tautonia marina]|uniref:DUF6498-containing protein n=1 Tax=Tautonia marina TaxID=2653855 RepID=UPI001260E7E1|nr:DUF6498-containing protein [Tautonia marina]
MAAAASKPHPAAILIENGAPLVGVLFFGWSVAPVMVVYWIENGLRGLETAVRMLLASGPVTSMTGLLPGLLQHRLESIARQARAANPEGDASLSPAEPAEPAEPVSRPPIASLPAIGLAGRVGMVLFFLVHYGLFWVVHGVFVFVLFVNWGPAGGFGGFSGMGGGAAASGLPTGQIALAGVLIGVTLGASVLRDLLQRDTDRPQPSPISLMIRAYGRVMLLHVVLIFGGFAIMLLGSPTPALVLLIGLKTAAELLAANRLDAPPSSA